MLCREGGDIALCIVVMSHLCPGVLCLFPLVLWYDYLAGIE